MRRFIISVLIAILIVEVSTAYVGGYQSTSFSSSAGITLTENLLTGDIDDEMAYQYGYNRGYEDYGLERGRRYLSIIDYYGRPHLPSWLTRAEVELAYWHKGKYIVGYQQGYADAMSKKVQLYSVEADGTAEAQARLTQESMPGYYPDVDEIDLSKGVASYGYEQGYADALAGKGKTPHRIYTQLTRVKTSEGKALLQRLQVDRGDYISNYKKGYDDATEGKELPEVSVVKTVDPTQLDYYSRQQLAYELGYDYGYTHAQMRKSKDPMGMFRFGPSSVPRSSYYNSYFSVSDDPVYDVALAHASKSQFITGYRTGYDAGAKVR